MGKEISDNLILVRERIAAAARKSGRSCREVTLVAASKTVAVENILEAINAGQKVFGENYVQEGRNKIEVLRGMGVMPPKGVKPIAREGKGVQIHLIGKLQHNKVKYAVMLFDVIESVHSKEIASAISNEAEKRGLVQTIYVQINIAEEGTKSGVMPDEAKDLCKYAMGLRGVDLQGLMTIGSLQHLGQDLSNIRRREFEDMRMLKADIERDIGAPITEISMGMSDDFELAIECGATVVRVGRAIFGSR